MTIYAGPGATVEATLMYGTSGLAGTVRVSIVDTPSGSTFLAASTSGIVEVGAKGVYAWSGTGPSTAGGYTVFWDLGSDATTIATEDLVVTATGVAAVSPSGTDLTTLARVKTYMQRSDALFDTELAILISNASAAVEQYANREFTDRGSKTRRFRVAASQSLLDLNPYDLRSVASVNLNPETASPTLLTQNTHFTLGPEPSATGTYRWVEFSPVVTRTSTLAVFFGYSEVEIVGSWGMATCPSDVEQAAVMAVAYWFRSGVAAFGTGLTSGDIPTSPAMLPPGVRDMLQPYKRMSA